MVHLPICELDYLQEGKKCSTGQHACALVQGVAHYGFFFMVITVEYALFFNIEKQT